MEERIGQMSETNTLVLCFRKDGTWNERMREQNDIKDLSTYYTGRKDVF